MKKLMLILALVAMFAGTSVAAEWNFYGSARVETFYTSVDTPAGQRDTKNLSTSVQSNSRIGANVKVSDELSGRFEYGTGVNVRLLYGVWNFGAGSLLAGQDYTPLRFPGSNQTYATDNGLAGFGEMYGGRKAQLKLRFGGFQVAAMAPDRQYYTIAAGVVTPAPVTTFSEGKLPGLAAKYRFSGENWNLGAAVGYSTFKIEDTTLNKSDDVTSYVLGVGGDLSFGAFTFTANVHGGKNPGNLTVIDTNGTGTSTTDVTGRGYAKYATDTGKVTDTNAMGYKLTAAYTVNDMFGLEAGYGYQEIELDEPASSKDKVASYYLQAPITLAPGVYVVPELGVIDYEEATQNKTSYFGAKWQINF